MVRSELVLKLVAKNPDLSGLEIQAIVDIMFREIAAALSRGDRVELRGFGSLTTRLRPARVGRNPRSGHKVEVSPKRWVYFRQGVHMGLRLNRR